MPAGVAAWKPLANLTVASSAASVTFSSIDQTYRDLVLVMDIISSGAGGSGIMPRFNGDSGTNYNYVVMQGNGTSAASGQTANMTYLNVNNNNPTNVNRWLGIVNIMDYTATDKHKSTLTRSTSPANAAEAFAGRWASTAAITSISITSVSNNFGAGSTFTLYGVTG